MKLLVFAASMRKDSFNRKLARRAVEILRKTSAAEIDHADFREFTMPVYDGDLETASGIPDGGKELIHRIQNCDAMIISTPEYNGSIPGALKNAIDWVSRQTPQPLKAKPLLLLGASPGALGAVRSLWHTRVPFEVLGVCVYSDMFGLAKADQAFAADGSFVDPKNEARVTSLIEAYLKFAERLLRDSF